MARGITTSRGASKTQLEEAITERLGSLKLVVLTQSQYDALSTKDANTLYFITE
jgi:hypothetical protein